MLIIFDWNQNIKNHHKDGLLYNSKIFFYRIIITFLTVVSKASSEEIKII